jgi:hypothetical protein
MAYTDSIVRPPPPFPQASPALLAPSQQAECEESESTSQAGDQVGELLLVVTVLLPRMRAPTATQTYQARTFIAAKPKTKG